MVEFWNDHGLHLWFGQCSKLDPCQRRLEQPLTWRSYSVILCPRQTSTSTSSTSTFASIPWTADHADLLKNSRIWAISNLGPKFGSKKNAFHEQYMATSWNAGISLIQTARILPGSTASHSSYHWPTVSLLLQEYSSCYRTSIFWLKSTVFKLPHMFSWHYSSTKQKCTTT